MQMDQIGKGIALLRKQMGLSQEELGQQIGVTRQAVSRWESGTAMPSVDNMIELARVLNASVDELLQLSEPPRDGALSAQSVGRLLDEHALRQEARIRRLTIALIAAAALLSIGVVLSALLGIHHSNRMENSVNAQIKATNAQLQAQISGMSAGMASTVRQALDEGNTRLADSGCRTYVYDHASTSLQLQLFAYPQLLGESSGAEFYALLDDGSRISAPAVQVPGGFEVTLSLPAASDEEYLSVDAYVSWQESGETVTEKILSRAVSLDQYRLRILSLWANMRYQRGDGFTFQPHAIMTVPFGNPSALPIKVRFDIYMRGDLVESIETPCACDPESYWVDVSTDEPITFDGAVEDILLRATVTDASGNTFTQEYIHDEAPSSAPAA